MRRQVTSEPGSPPQLHREGLVSLLQPVLRGINSLGQAFSTRPLVPSGFDADQGADGVPIKPSIHQLLDDVKEGMLSSVTLALCL
jgi:hypothetical protein